VNSNELISVVVPTHDRAVQLDRCLSSLFNQSTQYNYEVIVVDDASTDETQKLLKRYSKKHPNLEVIINPKNMGSYYSRNVGVSYSKGNIVAFTDSDTIVPTNWLSKIHEAFQNNEILCIQGTSISKGKWELPIPKKERLNHKVFRIRKGLDTKNLAIRRDLILEYRFDERFRSGGDQDLGHRLAKDHINIMYNPDIIVTHIDMRGFWDSISKGKDWGEDYAMFHKKDGWKSVNPKLRYPIWVLIFYYIGSFFYFLLKYRSFRGSLTMATRNLVAAFNFKKIVDLH